MNWKPTDYDPRAPHHNGYARWVGEDMEILTGYSQETYTLIDYRHGHNQLTRRVFNTLEETQRQGKADITNPPETSIPAVRCLGSDKPRIICSSCEHCRECGCYSRYRRIPVAVPLGR